MYKTQIVTMMKESGEVLEVYHILRDNAPVYRINSFLDFKGKNSINTSKQYATELCKFLNFLEEKRNKTYKQTRVKDVLRFLDNLLYGGGNAFYISEGSITYGTLSHYLSVIKEFYMFLEDEMDDEVEIKLGKKRRSAKFNYLYGQIWDMDTKKILNRRVLRTKSTKEYTKWYTEEEKETILDNFTSLRDKAIFLLTLEGLRIDEAISLREVDFDSTNMEVKLFKSKGRETGNVGSVVVLPIETVKIIDDYIFSERDEAIIRLQEKYTDVDYPQALFINLKDGSYLGKPLSYWNYLRILKRVAKKAGLVPERIRTHSGRSTKTMELLHHQAEYPEDNLTDEQIRQLMRWQHPKSINPYKNTMDKRLAIASAQKINNRKKAVGSDARKNTTKK